MSDFCEPWSLNLYEDVGGIYDSRKAMVAQTMEQVGFHDAAKVAKRNELARRIIAAVNACRGMSMEWLEEKPLSDRFTEKARTIDTALRERDEARAIVRELRNAVAALLVGIDKSLPESFPGHSEAYLRTVAEPEGKRAKQNAELALGAWDV